MGKGDARRPTAKSFLENHDKLDWNNDKTPAPEPVKRPTLEWVWDNDTNTGQWVEVPDEPK